LNSLVRTLVGCEFTPKAFQYASHVFQNLAVLSTASSALLSDLSDSANKNVEDLIFSLKELRDPAKVDMKKFSQSKAAPAKFLRLIKTTSSLCLQPSKEDRAQDKLIESFKAEDNMKLIEKIKSLGRFEKELEETIKSESEKIESAEKLQFALVLLPVIESFFLVHRLLQALMTMTTTTTSTTETTEPSPVLIKFSEEHRGLLNSLIRTKPSLLTQGSLVTLTRLPRVLDFDNKRIFFRQQLHRRKPDKTPVSTLNITVQRAHVFEDSFRALQGKSGEELKWGRLSIKFAEEEGVDAGGVAREWFSVLARQMFNPDYALFRTSAADRITYQPNRMSYINPDHLLYFHFIGRIIGKAVFDSRLLDCHFTRSFYKHILRIPVETKDMEAVDPELYKSLCWIEDNDITGVFDDLTFTTESDEFGTVKSVELKEDGSNIFVTEENKLEYVQLLTEFKLTTAIKPQIDSFLRGFNEIIPAHLISVFNEQELELLISGMPEIDLDDWKANCDYQGGYTIASPQVQWFWRAVRSFDSETRAKLIQFVTGTSKVPLEGFSKLQGSDGIQKFQIHRDPRTKSRLPTAHTCFNQLELPEYETYEELRQQLLLAINEGETGFGFI
jgi:E3 ubiquitin-protein ligase HUWE1